MNPINWINSAEGQDVIKKLYDHGLGLNLPKEIPSLLLQHFPKATYTGLAYRTRIVPFSKFTSNSLNEWDYSYSNISWSKDPDMWDEFVNESIELYQEHIFFDVWSAEVSGVDLIKLFHELDRLGIATLRPFKQQYQHEQEILAIEYSTPKIIFTADREKI